MVEGLRGNGLMSVFEMRQVHRHNYSVDVPTTCDSGFEEALNVSGPRRFACSEALSLTSFEPVRDPMEFHSYRGIENLNKGRWDFRCFGPATHSDRRSVSTWRGHVANGILFRIASTA
jgi:hypothetical protein